MRILIILIYICCLPLIAQEQILREDRFEDPDSNAWWKGSHKNVTVIIENGVYKLNREKNKNYWYTYINNRLNQENDYSIDLELKIISQSDNSNAGIIIENTSNRYSKLPRCKHTRH